MINSGHRGYLRWRVQDVRTVLGQRHVTLIQQCPDVLLQLKYTVLPLSTLHENVMVKSSAGLESNVYVISWYHGYVPINALSLTTLKYVCLNNGNKRCFFQFEVIINVLVRSFRFIWIPRLCVYNHYIFFNSSNAGIVFRRQILTSKAGPRAEKL